VNGEHLRSKTHGRLPSAEYGSIAFVTAEEASMDAFLSTSAASPLGDEQFAV